jgi:uncharacterized protein (TIGR03084 family)
MLAVAKDLMAEAAELHAFLETLGEADWQTPTLFKAWTPWDVLAHLHYSDEAALEALEGAAALAERRKQVLECLASDGSLAELQREVLGGYDAPTLLERWKSTCDEMARRLGESDPGRRLPWFGPDMGVRMFTTARYMETWAHAQAIYDLKGVERVYTDRIEHICTIGVKTFGWTFVNRQLQIPNPVPYVRLVAPSGAIWEWNEPSEVERVEGEAVDFCRVVTQTRNVADTGLRITGSVARHWMSIAQCFAGTPSDPPPPGARRGA